MVDVEYLALLRAVIENPLDDTPRLVLADWLQEHDQDERAEFIRLQIELARHEPVDQHAFRYWSGQLDSPKWVDEVTRLRRREGELFNGDGLGGQFLDAVRDWTSPKHARCEQHEDIGCGEWGRGCQFLFKRGFLSEVRCRVEDWVRFADGLYWSPRQTETCPECEGRKGEYRYPSDDPLNQLMSGDMWYGCWGCGGKGKVPRPFPAGAWPVERVVLSGSAHYMADLSGLILIMTDHHVTRRCRTAEYGRVFRLTSNGNSVGIEDVFGAEWPGIDFRWSD